VLVDGFETWLTGVFFTGVAPDVPVDVTGVFFTGVDVDATAGAVVFFAVGRGFTVPSGVRGLTGVFFDALLVAVVDVLFSFAGAFLTGVTAFFDATGVVELGIVFFTAAAFGVADGVDFVAAGADFFAAVDLTPSATLERLPTLAMAYKYPEFHSFYGSCHP
jgi:hypothetical protein